MQSSTVSIAENIFFTQLENAEPFNDFNFFEFFEELKPRLQRDEEEANVELIERMNRFFILCNEGANGTPFWIFEDRTIDEERIIDWFPITLQKATALFAKYNYEVTIPNFDGGKKKTIEMTVFKLWKTHRSQRLVTSIAFHPQLPPGFLIRNEREEKKIIFNRWTGFSPKILVPIEDFETELADLRRAKILFHVKEVISRESQQIYDFLLDWMASIIQKPWEKISIVPVVCGIQGAGKSIFWENFAKIFGIHGLVTPDASLITDKFFGADLSTKIFVTVGETNFKVDTREANALKNQITSTTRKAEKKFQDIKIQRDFVNMAWSSNDPLNAFPVEKGSNRRYFLVEADGRRANTIDYFTELVEAFEGDNLLGLRAFFWFLKSRELRPNCVRFPPHTEEKADAVLSTFNEFETWWFKCLNARTWVKPTNGSTTDPEEKHWVTLNASKKELFDCFLFSLRSNKSKENWGDDVKFANDFKKILPPIDQDLPQHYYAESAEFFTMPKWRNCYDYFHHLKGLTNPLRDTIKNKKRSGEALSNDRNKITSFLMRTN